jgi:predicted adenine nucleotide alpha hydrolase (AANH) superfamily ATPase
MKEKLLLHICCAPCGAYPIRFLQNRFDVILFFCGPNIHPIGEYNKRLEAGRKLSVSENISLNEADYNPGEWQEAVRGYEKESEGSERCKICYRFRLNKTAEYAARSGCKYFGTTLTIGPHKSASIINPIGEKIASEFNLIFLAEDFKKQDGFKKGCGLSKELGLYRQNYCGCEYSIRKEKNNHDKRNY